MKRKKKPTKEEGAALIYRFLEEEFLQRYGNFVCLEDETDLDLHVGYICYRVESELYDILIERGEMEEGMSWSEFVVLLRHWPDGLERSRAVARYVFFQTMKDPSIYPFIYRKREQLTERDLAREEDDNIPSALVLPIEEGRAMVSAFLYRAQVIQYHLMQEEGEKCSWNEYLGKVYGSQELFGKIIWMMHNGLTNINYRAGWLAEEEDVMG